MSLVQSTGHRLNAGEALVLPIAAAEHWLTAAFWPATRTVYVFDPQGDFPDGSSPNTHPPQGNPTVQERA